MEIQKNIVRIFDDTQHVVGSGFLVTKSRIVTTAHVIAGILGIPKNTITPPKASVFLDFPFSKSKARYAARIVFWQKQYDIAELEIEHEPPPDVTPARLIQESMPPGSVFRAYGFPPGYENGVWAAGELVGETAEGLLQLSAKRIGHTIQPGFSGSPVIDSSTGGVTGILVSHDMTGSLAYAVPVSKAVSGLAEIQSETSQPLQVPIGECPTIFLCHASEDKPAVRRIYTDLKRDGFLPWLDEEDLLPGQKWDVEIRKAVRRSDAILVCLSRNSVTKRGYVQKEIKFALDIADEQPEDVIFLIPALLESCKVPDRLSDFQWVDLSNEAGYSKLLRSLELVREANCQ